MVEIWIERRVRMNTWKKILAVSCLCAAASSPFAAYADAAKSVHEATLVAAPADYENIAVSQVSDYVNIREQATTNSKIVGKIYNNCAATILVPHSVRKCKRIHQIPVFYHRSGGRNAGPVDWPGVCYRQCGQPAPS